MPQLIKIAGLAATLLCITGFITIEKFKTYCNSRFDFCIEYPGSFIKQPSPENDDGLVFLSKDKKAEIRTFGSLPMEELDSLREEFEISTQKIKISYQLIKKDWFIFSGIDPQGKIVYRKTVRKKINYMGENNTFVLQTLMITYPASQKKLYSAYCLKISKSL